MRLTRKGICAGTTLLWALLSALAWTHDNLFGTLNVLGFLTLITIPGLLTILGLGLGTYKFPFWHRFGQIIGWSILELLSFLLLCNTVLPHLHIYRPLDRRPLIIELGVLYIGIVIWSWARLKNFSYHLTLRKLYTSKLDAIFMAIPLLFVGLSITGPISLNNGSTGLITLLMLITMGIYIACIFALHKHLNGTTYAWAIYMMGLSLLLSTSLRSWYTTGHDIEEEYRVFQLAKMHGVWNVSDFRDPFNACLSITILPTLFANLLHVPDPYIYKVYFQLIFASVPVIIYEFMRRYLSREKAFLAVIYFIAFPTYFTDMCMMNRQEMGFLFVALMLLVIFETRLVRRTRQLLFMAFGIGMILSHYSTTYSTIAILLVVIIGRPFFNAIAAWAKKRKLFARTSIALPGKNYKKKPNITVIMVLSLALGAFLWNSVLTNTSTAGSVLQTMVNGITSGLKEDTRSNDVAYSLFSGASGASPAQQLQTYSRQTATAERNSAPPDTYYPASVVDGYPLKIAPEETVPLTAIGRALQRLHINVSSLNYDLKQSSAKLLQILVAIGLIYIVFRKKFNKTLEPEFFLLSIGFLIFLALQVLLPYLSIAYGVLRAFQQSLMVIGLLLVVGTYVLAIPFKKKWLRYGVPPTLAVLFFFSSTGAISQLLGGYQPQLNLDNSGQYYDTYYLHKSEVVESHWLQHTIQQVGGQANIQTDLFTETRLNSLTGLNAGLDITPGVVEKNAYVILGYTDVTKDQVTVSYNGNLITYIYPMAFLNQNKNLIYDNGGAEVYR